MTIGTDLKQQEAALYMFSQMIESSTKASSAVSRGSYFTLSTTAIVIMFFTSLVVSLYSKDFSLASDGFEISELLAPVLPESPVPDRPAASQPGPPAQPSFQARPEANVRLIDESTSMPTSISVAPNRSASRSWENLPFADRYIGGSGPAVGGAPSSSGTGSASSSDESDLPASPPVATKPPPAAVPPISRAPRNVGVINGKATYLPKPTYPASAILMNTQGDVSVQVAVDETGRVTASRAVSGPLMLRAPAERAALQAKFDPTYLSRVPVRVTGVIVYRFRK